MEAQHNILHHTREGGDYKVCCYSSVNLKTKLGCFIKIFYQLSLHQGVEEFTDLLRNMLQQQDVCRVKQNTLPIWFETRTRSSITERSLLDGKEAIPYSGLFPWGAKISLFSWST